MLENITLSADKHLIELAREKAANEIYSCRRGANAGFRGKNDCPGGSGRIG